MASSEDKRSYQFYDYYPDQPLGESGVPGTVLAGENVILEADGLTRVIGSPTDMGETYAPPTLSYTADLTANSDTINCSSGTLLADFVPYQHVLIGGVVYLIEELISNTQARISPTPTSTLNTQALQKILVMHGIEDRRFTLFAGNVIKYRSEPLFAVGNGEIKRNGASLNAVFNTQLTKPVVAYPNFGVNTYDVRPVGFTRTTAGFSAVQQAGGVKNMPLGTYGIRISKKRQGFPGFGLFSTVNAEPVISVANNLIRVTLPVFDTSEGQTSWLLWVTKAKEGQFRTGPWFLFGEFTTVTPSTIDIEWRDEELGEKYVDDNFPPPPALYTFSIDDLLVFASCFGKPDSLGNPTAPGPGLAIGKPNNPEGFPASSLAFTSPAENIRGVHVASTRVFLISLNYLHIVTLTGSSTTPLVIRPYWHAGAFHPGNGLMVGDVFYAHVGGMLIRSVTGEDSDTEFSRRVKSDFEGLVQQRSFLGNDIKNGLVCLFHANHELRGGFWITKVLVFNYKTNKWSPPTILSAAGADFTVTTCATVGDRLYFATQDGKVYRWDDGTATVVGYLATFFDNFGSDETLKTARRVSLQGRFNGDVRLYKDYDYTGLIAGTGSVLKTYSNPSFLRKHLPLWKPNFDGKSLALRMGFSMPGKTRNLADLIQMRVAVKDEAGY